MRNIIGPKYLSNLFIKISLALIDYILNILFNTFIRRPILVIKDYIIDLVKYNNDDD